MFGAKPMCWNLVAKERAVRVPAVRYRVRDTKSWLPIKTRLNAVRV